MKTILKKKLEAAGFNVGSVQEFLGLSEEESAIVEMKVRLTHLLREMRTQTGVTQMKLAKMMKSSQSRIAKMEAGDPDVSLDLICRALFVLGASRHQIARAIDTKKAA